MPGTVELNRLNDLSNYIHHLKTAHAENGAAATAVRRLEKASADRLEP